MLTIKKRGLPVIGVVAAASLLLTACGPPGLRALHKGDHLVQSGNYDQAIEALLMATNLLTQEPSQVQARAYNLLGLSYHHTGTNLNNARQCYLQALALDRDLAAADYNLACLEMEQGDLAAARDALTSFNSLQPRDWDGEMKLGRINYLLARKAPVSRTRDKERLADYDSAAKAFEKAQTIKSTAEGLNDLAMIDLFRSSPPSREAISNAVIRLRAAKLTDPQYAPAFLNLAVVYDTFGPYKYADINNTLKAYREYLALEPTPANAKEVGTLVTNLDTKSRFSIVTAGHTVEQPIDPGPSGPSTPGLIIKYKKPPPPPPMRQTPLPPPAVATNPPPTARIPTPVVEPVPTPVPIPPPKPEETLPVHIDTSPVTATVEPPALASNTVAEPVPPATVPGKPPVDTNNPLPSTIVRQPSLLARVFGSKTKPAEGETVTNPGDNARGVTPLPVPEKIVHYLPPPDNTEPGNRIEADLHVKEGAAASQQAHWKEAMTAYEMAVKADPSDYEACEGLGIAAIKADEFASALESLHHALALNPESANARYDYAWTLQKKNYPADAAVELEKLLELHPAEVRAHLLLGTLYAQPLGQPDFARGHYKRVLELDPQNAEAAKIRLWLKNNPEL